MNPRFVLGANGWTTTSPSSWRHQSYGRVRLENGYSIPSLQDGALLSPAVLRAFAALAEETEP